MAARYFHWDEINDCVLQETDESSATTVTYTHEPGQFGKLLSDHRGGIEYHHHYDAQGSTQFLTNVSSTVTDTFVYDAWGNSVARTGTTLTPYQWIGRWGYQAWRLRDAGQFARSGEWRFVRFDPIGGWTERL